MTWGKSKKQQIYGNFWETWRNIQTRCTNLKGNDYKNYGGRGIKCLWSSFKEFRNDMYFSYLDTKEVVGEKKFQVQIDRIDPNGHYCKENCRWVTPKVQQRNRTNNRLIEWEGEVKSLAEWAETIGLNSSTLSARLRNPNYTLAQAMKLPLSTRAKK